MGAIRCNRNETADAAKSIPCEILAGTSLRSTNSIISSFHRSQFGSICNSGNSPKWKHLFEAVDFPASMRRMNVSVECFQCLAWIQLLSATKF